MPSRWYKHPALPTGATPFKSCLCTKAEALPVRPGYGWDSRRIFIYAALYGCRISHPFSVQYRPASQGWPVLQLPFPRPCSLHGFSALCAGPVFLPAYSRILHKSVDYMLALWHDGKSNLIILLLSRFKGSRPVWQVLRLRYSLKQWG